MPISNGANVLLPSFPPPTVNSVVSRLCATTASLSVPGPCGAPDVPNGHLSLHRSSSINIANESSVSSKLAPPSICDLAKQSRQQAIRITLKITLLHSLTVEWDSILYQEELFVHIPSNTTDNSKEAFIALLEFAEEELYCKTVIVYFDKTKSNRNTLIRLFNFVGFSLLPPGHQAIPADAPNDMLYMAYNIYE